MAPSVGTCVIEMSSDNGRTFVPAPIHRAGEVIEPRSEEYALSMAAWALRCNDANARARVLRHGADPIYLRRTVNGVVRYQSGVVQT